MSESSLAPHISAPYAPLSELVMRALRKYGEMHPSTVDGDTMLMFVGFANEIIEEIRRHPYCPTDLDLDYYVAQDETREIPDAILVAGLLYYYALQQFSAKAETYGPAYYRTLNGILYNIKSGNKKINLNTVDRDNDEDTTRE